MSAIKRFQKRSVIQLTSEQFDKLKKMSLKTRIPFSELVRQAIDDFLRKAK